MILFLFSTLFLLSACSDDDLPKYSNLGGLRILALQVGANGGAAEFMAGDTVTITPWISDFKGGARTLSFSAMACVDPGIAQGVEPSCVGVPGAVAVATDSAAAIPATERTGATTQLTGITIPASLLTGRSSRDKFNGVNYLVTYELVASDGEKTKAFKRLRVSENPSKNTNPTLAAIISGGAPLTSYPSGAVEISGSFSAGSIENYSYQHTDGTQRSQTEELLTTWFISSGELSLFRTLGAQTTEFKPASGALDHTPLMIAVTRDGRGGVSVFVQSL